MRRGQVRCHAAKGSLQIETSGCVACLGVNRGWPRACVRGVSADRRLDDPLCAFDAGRAIYRPVDGRHPAQRSVSVRQRAEYKKCCQGDGLNRTRRPAGAPVRTIDATGRGCRWTVYARAAADGAGPGEVVEHHCSGERFEAAKGTGWLHDGESVSVFQVLDRVPPELCDWVVRQSLEAVSDEELTPLGIDVVRLIALAGTVVELVGDPRKLKRRGGSRSSQRRRRRAAA